MGEGPRKAYRVKWGGDSLSERVVRQDVYAYPVR